MRAIVLQLQLKSHGAGGNKHLFILLRDNPRCRTLGMHLVIVVLLRFFMKRQMNLDHYLVFTVGNGGFGYSFGHGYVVDYEGVFPEPSLDDYSGRD